MNPAWRQTVLPADNRCRLADLEEGRIGSLRVHQSGRKWRSYLLIPYLLSSLFNAFC
ncbi:hypothetical protein MSG28_011682 [Choristoneura fumiferana]|uniref:Uncharacterized protein n=1 Tax=Choristoneura fumiferana TaxID=7141 RepID=A0ACC0KM77_CHOFU|nr:hypothetical protein MSG28_011682 [Choristoneura fumiferana]